MRHCPSNKSERDELKRLNLEPWMPELLKLNPDYVLWGPHENYMWKKGDGWDSPRYEPWGGQDVDDLNEIVNFYFEVGRKSEQCGTCGGKGYHRDAQWVSESFYKHSSPFVAPDYATLNARRVMEQCGSTFTSVLGQGDGVMPDEETLKRYGRPFLEFCVRTMERGGHWNDDITEDEAAALVASGRGSLEKLVTADDFNRANGPGRSSHDAINRWILIEQRCKRLGVPLRCVTCNGYGYVYVAEKGHCNLILWVLHPRKGASRGVEVQNIQQSDLPAIYALLREAAERNAERFAKIPKM